MGKLHRLNQAKINAAKEPGVYADGGSLYLRVAPGGSKQWVFRFGLHGRTRDMGLGSLSTFSLTEARDRAHELRKQLHNRIDPIEHRRRERTENQVCASRHITFDKAAETYVAEHERRWRSPRSHEEWTRSLATYASPVFGKLPVSALDTALIVSALKPIWIETATVARRLRGRIESILDWAAAMGYRSGDNPARLNGHLSHLLPDVSRQVAHHAAMPYAEIPRFLRELQAADGVAEPALAFVILTAARAGEVAGMTWDELNGREWTIPAHRMKANVAHQIPLSDAAMALVERQALTRHSHYVFPGRVGRLSGSAMLDICNERNCTTHGFRSSFRDWCAEQTNTPREICEMALAHKVGNAVERAYQRSKLFEKRAELMEAWGRYCAETVPLPKLAPVRT